MVKIDINKILRMKKRKMISKKNKTRIKKKVLKDNIIECRLCTRGNRFRFHFFHRTKT